MVYPNFGTMTTIASSPIPMVMTTRRVWMHIVTGGIPSPFRPPVRAGGLRIWRSMNRGRQDRQKVPWSIPFSDVLYQPSSRIGSIHSPEQWQDVETSSGNRGAEQE